VQVSTSSSFASIYSEDSLLTSGSKVLSGLAGSTIYYWRVRAKNSVGTSTWATTWSFTTGNIILATPTLVSPADSATNVSIAPILKWNSMVGCTYNLQVLNGSTILINLTGLTDTVYSLSGLTNAAVYTWKVSATSTGGTSAQVARTFTTIVPIPGPVTILSPLAGATIAADSVRIIWNRTAYADSFHVKVASIVDTVISDTFFVMRGLSNGQYGIGIQAINKAGSGILNSGIIFTVDLAAMSMHNLNSRILVTSVSIKADMINYSLASNQQMSLSIFDIQGRLILSKAVYQSAGTYSIGINNLSRGVYIIRFRAGDYRHDGKIILK
jgi:hypothetical protein